MQFLIVAIDPNHFPEYSDSRVKIAIPFKVASFQAINHVHNRVDRVVSPHKIRHSSITALLDLNVTSQVI